MVQITSLVNAEEEIAHTNGSPAIAQKPATPQRENSKRSTNSRNRDEMTERQQREANLGTILVCISLLFILCQSIKIIPDVSNFQ